MTLAEKIHKIMQNVEYIGKDTHVSFKSTNYKAVSEEKVTSAIRQQFVDLGVLMYPIEQDVSRTGDIATVKIKYRIQNAEDTGDYIDVVSAGEGADYSDKAIGKALTYCYKYALLRTFAIPTGEDPDRISTEEQLEKVEKNRTKVNNLIEETETDVETFLYAMGKYFGRDIESVDEMSGSELVYSLSKLKEKKKLMKNKKET